ncbi:hypothetical protein [Mycolicibacterium sp. XJ1904]
MSVAVLFPRVTVGVHGVVDVTVLISCAAVAMAVAMAVVTAMAVAMVIVTAMAVVVVAIVATMVMIVTAIVNTVVMIMIVFITATMVMIMVVFITAAVVMIVVAIVTTMVMIMIVFITAAVVMIVPVIMVMIVTVASALVTNLSSAQCTVSVGGDIAARFVVPAGTESRPGLLVVAAHRVTRGRIVVPTRTDSHPWIRVSAHRVTRGRIVVPTRTDSHPWIRVVAAHRVTRGRIVIPTRTDSRFRLLVLRPSGYGLAGARAFGARDAGGVADVLRSQGAFVANEVYRWLLRRCCSQATNCCGGVAGGCKRRGLRIGSDQHCHRRNNPHPPHVSAHVATSELSRS